MKSFDVWDTLIGRWYYDPMTIFQEMEKTLGFEYFTATRKHAEFVSHGFLPEIYAEFQRETGVDDATRERFLELEKTLERDRSFRIGQMVQRLENKFMVVSDFYFPPDDLRALLDHHDIHPTQLYVSVDGKRTGKIWKTITEPIEIHIGDNYESDFNSPRNAGILAEHIKFTRLNSIESWLYGNCTNLGCLARATRLSGVATEHLKDVWNEATEKTVPLLVMLSHYLKEFCNVHNFDRILFTQRDCNYLYEIFSTLYPHFDSRLFHSSRECYQRQTEGFVKYVKHVYTPTTLIVDLQGTGDTCFNFFANQRLPEPNYFTVVNSDRSFKIRPTKHSIVSWQGNSTDRVEFSDRIEKLNYINLGRVIDVYSPDTFQYLPIRADLKISEEVETIYWAIMTAKCFLLNGFDVSTPCDKRDIIIKMLRYIEDVPMIIDKYVNHEVF